MIIGITICFSKKATAQDIPLDLIGSGGGYFHHTTIGDLHWSVGEIMTETYSNGDVLTQGFHQLYYNLVPVWEVPDLQFELSIYPNPTTDWINLKRDNSNPMNASLFNVLGQKMMDIELSEMNQEIDLGAFAEGMYLLSIYDKNRILKTYRIQKVSL